MEYSDTTIVIPAKNEPAIAKVTKQILKALPKSRVIIVYMGEKPKISGVKNVKLLPQKGKGYGNALKQGFNAANTNIIGTIDGDGTYEPNDLPKIVARVRSGYDLVTGNRLVKGNERAMFSYIRLGNTVATWAYNILFMKPIGDSQSGIRAMNKKMLKSLNLKQNGMMLPTEMNCKAAKRGYAITNVPTKYYLRVGEPAFQNKLSYGFKIFAMTILFRFRD